MKVLRNYQQEASEWMSGHNTYLMDDCGLGKTITAIEAVKRAGLAGRKGLVICAKSARLQWRNEIWEQCPGANVIITDHLKWKFKEIDAWFITTYDECTPKRLLYPLNEVIWNFMIIDEAHRLKNNGTARSKNIRKLRAGRKIALSATPIEKHGGELWPVLHWLDREWFGESYWNWVEEHFEVKQGFYGGFEIGEPLDLLAYQARIMPFCIRRTKEDVAPELPEKILVDVDIEMTPRQKQIYQEIKLARDSLVTIEDKHLLIENALALFTRLHQVASLPSMVGFDLPSSKIEWLHEWLEDNKFLRCLVFSRYRAPIEYVYNHFQNHGGVYRVMQGVNEAELYKNSHCRILAGTIDAMSESLSLEMADAAIFLDQHWSATQMKQAVDRIHRMNITGKKLIYFLQACPEDKKVMKVVNGKYDDQQMLLDFIRGRDEQVN
jgi:SNF2 family DNA or RNA helicase